MTHLFVALTMRLSGRALTALMPALMVVTALYSLLPLLEF